MNVTLTPLPGKDYKSKKAALADYNAGKDFILNVYNQQRRPINKEQCDAENFAVTIRYGNLRKAFVI